MLPINLYHRWAITDAIKYRSKLDVPLNYKIAVLRENIENGPYNVFGSYKNVLSRFFVKCLFKHKNKQKDYRLIIIIHFFFKYFWHFVIIHINYCLL